MAVDQPCSRCGARRPAGGPAGLCPRCLLRLASGDDFSGVWTDAGVSARSPSVLTALDQTAGPIPRLLLRDIEAGPETPVLMPGSDAIPAAPDPSGRYHLMGEIARGGMGAVLKGRDTDLGRDLAVKVLLDRHRGHPELVRRFVEEAQIGGQLQHPGIVPVYELGMFPDSRPFFTMKLVKGRTFAAILHARRDPEDDQARLLGIFEQVCQTVAYAHARGVIHRDLKPSNVMVGSFGEVQLMDWGLAKVLAAGGMVDDAWTLRHEEEGPVRTARSDSEADASQAGSVLGTPAYMAPEQARGEVGSVDERADVFGLGSILCEVLTGLPAYVGPSGPEVLSRARQADLPEAFARLDRCKADAELVGLARDCLAATPGDRPRDAGVVAGRLSAHLQGVQQRLRDAELARAQAQARAEEEAERRLLADQLAHEAQARAVEVRKRLQVSGALAVVLVVGLLGMAKLWTRAESSAEIARDNEQTARMLAEKEASARAEAQAQEQIALDRAETLARQDYINRVNRAYREVQDDNVALAEDLLHGCPPGRRGWEWHYVERLCNAERLTLDLGNASVSALAFGPDGNWAVSVSGTPMIGASPDLGTTVAVWDVANGHRRRSLPGARGIPHSVAVSPDGRWIAAGCGQGLVVMWDAATGRVTWTRSGTNLDAMSIAFSPDGKSLAVGYGMYSENQVGTVEILDAATGEKIRSFPSPRGGANEVAFHLGSKRLAVAGSGVVELWDLDTTVKIRDFKGHAKWVYAVAFSPDGKSLATGGWDRTVKLWDVDSGAEKSTIFAHEGFVLDLAFSPDGRNLATVSEDRSLKLWDIPSCRLLGAFHGHTDFLQAVAFRPGSPEIATGSLDGTLRFWDMRTSRPVVFEHTGWVERLAVRRDGLRVLSEPVRYKDAADRTKGWDPLNGEVDPSLRVRSLGVLPAGFVAGSGYQEAIATSPDGKLVAQISPLVEAGAPSRSREYATSAVVIRDVATFRVVHTLTGHSADVASVTFSPDGRRLATASSDRTIKIWDTATGQDVFTLRGHTAGVMCLAFSPDGNLLISGGIDNTARVWNATPPSSKAIAEHDARYGKKIAVLAQAQATTDHVQHADVLARGGRWGLAAIALGKAIEDKPDELPSRYRQLLSLLQSGDLRGCRHAAEDLASRFGKSTDLNDLNYGAWCCTLAPDAIADPAKLIHMAEEALAGYPEALKRSARTTLGAALYRAGRLDEAIRQLDESLKSPNDRVPQTWAFLAMAHHRKGNREEAHRWLEKLRSHGPSEPGGFSWPSEEIRIIRREAESLVQDSRPPARS